MKKISLGEALEGIKDTRRKQSVQYPLHEILMIMLLAIICGATSYRKIEIFGKSKEEWLKKYMKLENGIPDACTIRDVVMVIDSKKLHEIFVEWMKGVAEKVFGVVAIDGKTSRGTKYENTKALHTVSAFSYEYGVVLGQLACEEKSNEITAIPLLLEMLEIAGCIVTIDAMGCQKEIAEKIIDKGADYCLSLKKNQRDLYEDIEFYAKNEFYTEDKKELENNNQYHSTLENSHGRIEKREYYVSNDVSWLKEDVEKFKNLSGFGVCVSTVEQGGKTTISHNYAIYSVKDMTAKQFADIKRGHWSIENNLHWVLDVAFRDDESRARMANSAEVLNVLKHIAFNILNSEKSLKCSISDKQFNCLLNESYLEKVIANFLCS